MNTRNSEKVLGGDPGDAIHTVTHEYGESVESEPVSKADGHASLILEVRLKTGHLISND